MRSFELYGTVEAVVCTLDGINHLTKKEDVCACFRLVHNYLVPNGVFVFDENGIKGYIEFGQAYQWLIIEQSTDERFPIGSHCFKKHEPIG